MDFTIDPNETAGEFLARGGVIRGMTDGSPDPWNLPPDTLVGDLVTDGSRTLPVLHAAAGVVERVVRLDAAAAGRPTRATAEAVDRVLRGPDNAPSWDVVGESVRWVLYTDAAGYDLAGVRILTLEPDQVRLTVCHWLPSGAATAVEILQTLARNFPELRPAVEPPPSGGSAPVATRESPPGEPAEAEKRGMKVGTADRVKEAHRRLKLRKASRNTIFKQVHVDPRTYDTWCKQVTGEDPVEPYLVE